MNQKRITTVAFLLILVFMTPLASAQVVSVIKGGTRIINLYQDGLSSFIDTRQYTETGEIIPLTGKWGIPMKASPGPAPDPYPHVHVWEKGIEQLGPDPNACDGMYFINGQSIHPGKHVLVLWNIQIPSPSIRMGPEFDRDMTVSLWVDWNQDNEWTKNELMICENLNLSDEMPTDVSCVEVKYLTMFRVPWLNLAQPDIGDADVFYKVKLWARGVLTYDDPDPSPDGESLFGEAEDFRLSYFEVRSAEKKME